MPPGPFPSELLDAFFYERDAFLWDELLEVDPELGTIRARLTVDPQWPLVRSQRVDESHPRHMNGALLLHATASLGFAHAYLLLGLGPAGTWTGYATHIHRGVFRALVPAGGEIDGTCMATSKRSDGDRQFVRYRFDLRHDGRRCYDGEHTAVWIRTN